MEGVERTARTCLKPCRFLLRLGRSFARKRAGAGGRRGKTLSRITIARVYSEVKGRRMEADAVRSRDKWINRRRPGGDDARNDF